MAQDDAVFDPLWLLGSVGQTLTRESRLHLILCLYVHNIGDDR